MSSASRLTTYLGATPSASARTASKVLRAMPVKHSSCVAEPVRGHDHVGQLQDRVVPGCRLDLEDVEPGARDAPRAERLVQRLLLDDRSARGVDDVGGLLHQPELVGPDQALGPGAQRAVDRHEVGTSHHLVEAGDHLDVEALDVFGLDERVVGDVLHLERHRETEHLGTDIADADQPEGATGEAHAHVAGLLGPASFAREPVLEEELLRQRQHEGDDVGRHRPAHAVRRQCEHHAVRGAGRHVDRVVADAEARHQLQAMIAAREARGVHPFEHGADHVVPRRELGRHDRQPGRHVRPLDVRMVEQGQHPRIVDRPAVGAHDIGRHGHAKLGQVQLLSS